MTLLSLVPVLYAVSAVFGILFIYYLFKILSETSLVGERPRSWVTLAVGLAMIATSSLIELVFVSDPGVAILNTFNLYFAAGNILVFIVLVRVWRDLEG